MHELLVFLPIGIALGLIAALVAQSTHSLWSFLAAPLVIVSGVTVVPVLLVVIGRIDFPINVFASWIWVASTLTIVEGYFLRYMWMRGLTSLRIPILASIGVFALLEAIALSHMIPAWRQLGT